MLLSRRQQYLTTLVRLTPLSAIGVSLALGGAVPAAASEPPDGRQPNASAKEGISERLAAVRDAVSAIADDKAASAKAEGRLAWGNWGFGYGWPNWNNWHNWRNWGNFFRNW
jgi:hypothetical protein